MLMSQEQQETEPNAIYCLSVPITPFKCKPGRNYQLSVIATNASLEQGMIDRSNQHVIYYLA